jgi:tRNA(adenine34) deaminase
MTLRLLILFLMALLFNSSVKILNAFVLVKHWRRRSPGSQVALGLRLCSTAVPSLQGLPGDPQFDEAMMKLALRHAQFAYRQKEVPIGAIVVSNKDGIVLSTARNSVEKYGDSTAHAELLAIRKASSLVKNWRLLDCTLYTTLEPCPMCMGAIQGSRINKVVYGAKDIRIGACGSWIDLRHGNPIEATREEESDTHNHDHSSHVGGKGVVSYKPHPYHNVQVVGGVLEYECGDIIKKFFKWRRREATMKKSEDKQGEMNDGLDLNRGYLITDTDDNEINEPIRDISTMSAIDVGEDEEFEMVDGSRGERR